MQLSLWFLAWDTVFAFVLFFCCLFSPLGKSEELPLKLQAGQASLLISLWQNAQMEKDPISSCVDRQAERKARNRRPEERAVALSKLLNQAEAVSRSP